MAQTIRLKRSAVAGRIPTINDLELGEVAINTVDGKMYIKKSVGGIESIVEVGSGGMAASAMTQYTYIATAGQLTVTGADYYGITLDIADELVNVYLNGVLLDPGIDYNIDAGGTTVTFVNALEADDLIQINSFDKAVFNGTFSVDKLVLNGGTGEAGTLSWNTEDETIDLIVSPDVTYQLGQELGLVARNLSGSTLTNGDVVKVTGASGNKITVDVADASTELGSAPTVGVVTETINNNSTGRITTAGLVRGLNTSSFTEGVAIYLGSNGAFTATKPSSPNHLVHIGWVVRSHATEGAILVHVNNGWELEELHDVLITSIADNQILQWNNTTLVWENVDGTTSNIAEGTNLYWTTARGDSNFTTNLAASDTDDLSEGVTNLYYTSARANADFDTRLATKSTTNLAEGTNLYYTTARANADFDTRLATKSTTNLAEGTNLYYTTARFDTAFSGKSTTDLTEGTNLYFTNARARSAISVTGSLSYDSGTGVISYTTPTTIASLSNHDTDDLSEGVTNLYYTSARANTDFDTRLATKSTTDLSEGTNLYFTDARVGSYLTTNNYATQNYVDTAVSNLVDAAPTTLDTLNELAAALGDDPNFATTVSTAIGTKWTQDNTKISNWDTAYTYSQVGHLPLAGGTLTGDVNFTNNAYLYLGTSSAGSNLIQDAQAGWGDVLKVKRAGVDQWALKDSSGTPSFNKDLIIGGTGQAARYYIARPSDGATAAYLGFNSANNGDFGIYNSSGGGNILYRSNGGIHYFRNNDTNTFTINSSGTTTSVTSSNAPIFYDSADTSRYCDPNSWSSLQYLLLNAHMDIYGPVYSYKTDTGVILQSFNTSASNAGQFSITHDYTDVTVANSRGNINVTTPMVFQAAPALPSGGFNDGFGALYTFTPTMAVTTTWTDIPGISGSVMSTGTYAISLYIYVGGLYLETYSGMMSWYGAGTNDGDANEIPLHNSGHAENGNAVYLRTLRHYSGELTLQVASAQDLASSQLTIKCRRMI